MVVAYISPRSLTARGHFCAQLPDWRPALLLRIMPCHYVYAQTTRKRCTSCGELKPRTEYHKDSAKWDGRHSQCRECHSKHRAERRKDPAWRAKDVERSKQYKQTHRKQYKNSARNATLKKKYGIGLKEYQEIWERQGGVCAICASPDPKVTWTSNLYVDHCHTTKVVRGLLCHPCNVALGKMDDDPDRMRRAAEYLEASHQDITY